MTQPTERKVTEEPCDLDIRAAVEWCDPDWRDHFFDYNQAADFYREYAPIEWAEAVRESQ